MEVVSWQCDAEYFESGLTWDNETTVWRDSKQIISAMVNVIVAWRHPLPDSTRRENPAGGNPPPAECIAIFLKRKFQNWH